jgi:hypothetical protein
MGNFDYLSNYVIPSDILLNLLNIYKQIGKFEALDNDNINKYSVNITKSIEDHTFSLAQYIGVKVSFERLRLIITKDFLPKNKEEVKVAAVKKMLISMRENALKDKLPINSVDILDLLKKIYGSSVKLNVNDFILHGNSKKTVRYKFNTLLDSYDELLKSKKQEPIVLSSVAVMEMYNIKPYSEYNDLAVILTYYYFLLKCGVLSFKYVSFFKLFLNKKDDIFNEIIKGSINYDLGTLFFSGFLKKTLELITESFKQLENDQKPDLGPKANKGDYIKNTILYDVPDLFTKEDISKIHPNISPSTIVRALNELHDLNYIMPLGTGRSAKWKRLFNPKEEKIIKNEVQDENNN